MIPVVPINESPAGVAENEPLYRRANISYSYSTSDCVNSWAKILIGPNSPTNFPVLPAVFILICCLPKIMSPLACFNPPVGVPKLVEDITPSIYNLTIPPPPGFPDSSRVITR